MEYVYIKTIINNIATIRYFRILSYLLNDNKSIYVATKISIDKENATSPPVLVMTLKTQSIGDLNIILSYINLDNGKKVS